MSYGGSSKTIQFVSLSTYLLEQEMTRSKAKGLNKLPFREYQLWDQMTFNELQLFIYTFLVFYQQ